ncbi:MAG: gephyrin-like molybdotransferase Glp [bacterium]
MTKPQTTVEEARDIILDHTQKTPKIDIPVENSGGYVLAEDIEASEPVQPFRNAAMDGIACRYEDAKVNGQPLTIIGEVAAGDPGTITVQAGECVQIMTGAPVPDELDTVIRIEDCNIEENEVTFTRLPSKGEGDNIRNAGEDIQPGDRVLKAGQVLRPYELGVGVLSGRGSVKVHRQPRVAVLSTGNELVTEPGADLGPGQIRDINQFTLSEGARQAGAEVTSVESLPDDLDATLDHTQNLLEEHEIILTSGGISMGEYDFIGDVMSRLDVEFLFHKVWQKPGKPLGFGVSDGTLWFALPGNVVSSMVNFEVYVRPTIFQMRGIQQDDREIRHLSSSESLRETDRRTFFFRGQYNRNGDQTTVHLTETGQGSHVMTSMSAADCLIEVPPKTDVQPGDVVKTIDLQSPVPVPLPNTK